MEKFVFLEHTADAKFQAFGEAIEECFENSALALNSIEADLESVKPMHKKEIHAQGETQEELLHRFLEEMHFAMETEQMLFSKFEVKINGNSVSAEAWGEPIDTAKHEIKSHVKAITWNSFFLKKEKKKWVAQVVCDT
ncbi:MAG: archease [Candidatus Diapherotrites archaeon]|nr:archease [Candidatus Diapherotrites archaeon]